MNILSVLYVDDDERYRKSVIEMLSNTGISVTTVPSAEEAIKILPQSNFSIAIIDIEMPGVDGFKVLDFIMDNRLPPKVIMITSTNEQAMASGIRGAQWFIDKPFNLKTLVDAINTALKKEKIYDTRKPRLKHTKRNSFLKRLRLFGHSK